MKQPKKRPHHRIQPLALRQSQLKMSYLGKYLWTLSQSAARDQVRLSMWSGRLGRWRARDRGFIVFACRVTVVEAPVKTGGGRAKRGNRRR